MYHRGQHSNIEQGAAQIILLIGEFATCMRSGWAYKQLGSTNSVLIQWVLFSLYHIQILSK